MKRKFLGACYHCSRPVPARTGFAEKRGHSWRVEHDLTPGEGRVTCEDAAREAEIARAQRAAANPLYPVNSKLIGVPFIIRRKRKGEQVDAITDNWRRLQKHIRQQRKAGGLALCTYRELPDPWNHRGDEIVEVADVIFTK